MPRVGYYDVAKSCNLHWANWQLFLSQLFLNETLHSRIEAPACVHKEIGDQNGKVPRRMIRFHTYLCYEMSEKDIVHRIWRAE